MMEPLSVRQIKGVGELIASLHRVRHVVNDRSDLIASITCPTRRANFCRRRTVEPVQNERSLLEAKQKVAD